MMEHLQELISVVDENILDIKRVIAICFRMGLPQSSDDLERIISFDMDWMDTDTAHDSIKALIFAGWLIEKDGMIEPNIDVRGIDAPIGWQPRPSRLTDPVVNSESIPKERKSIQIEDVKVANKSDSTTKLEQDPRKRMEKRLIKFISKKSGLGIEEIERRVKRKTTALSTCTKWLALCLLSREQGLEIQPIIDSLNST